jgi:hypothetical protein
VRSTDHTSVHHTIRMYVGHVSCARACVRTWREGRTLLTQFSYSLCFTSKRGDSTPTLLMRPISCGVGGLVGWLVGFVGGGSG